MPLWANRNYFNWTVNFLFNEAVYCLVFLGKNCNPYPKYDRECFPILSSLSILVFLAKISQASRNFMYLCFTNAIACACFNNSKPLKTSNFVSAISVSHLREQLALPGLGQPSQHVSVSLLLCHINPFLRNFSALSPSISDSSSHHQLCLNMLLQHR